MHIYSLSWRSRSCAKQHSHHMEHQGRSSSRVHCTESPPLVAPPNSEGVIIYTSLIGGSCMDLAGTQFNHTAYQARYTWCNSWNSCDTYPEPYCFPNGNCGLYTYLTAGTTTPAKNSGTTDCGCHEGSSGNGDSSTGGGAKGGEPAMVGDPINASTGNSYLQQDDYPDGGWLTLRRFYNGSAPSGVSALGPHWRHSFDRSLAVTGSPATSITVFRPDGFQEIFTKANGVWTSDPDVTDTLSETDNSSGVATSYTLFIAAIRHYEMYSASGQLQTVSDDTVNRPSFPRHWEPQKF